MVDLKTMEDPPMVDSLPEPQSLLVTAKNQKSNLTLVKYFPTIKKDHATTKWLETSMEKKRSIVPISMSIDDLVSKCLGKVPKIKKERIEARINFDKSLR